MIDIPPVWLLGALLIAWAQAKALPVLGWPGGGLVETFGNLFVAFGILLIVLGLLALLRAKTTPVPHREPEALATGGVFRFTRNPIYLGDALVLFGLILRWEAVLSLILVPAFVFLIDRRFIRAEEARLRAAFGARFEAYAAEVRRWI